MTLARTRDQARRYARIHSTWTSGSGVVDDDHVNELIQDSVKQFVDDAHGIEVETYLAIDADFTTRTTMGIHVAIADSSGTSLMDAEIAITGTDRNAVSGSQVATDLQVAIRAATGATGTETVTWTSFYFTIDFKQGATFTFTAPTTVTLADVRDRLGLIGPTTAATVVTGAFPEDCTLTADLPTATVTAERVEWNGNALTQLAREYAQSPESSGTPRYYHIRARKLYLIPAPTIQDDLHLWYRGQPADIDFAADTDLPSGIPEMYHTGIAYLAASKLLEEAFDEKRAFYRKAQYRDIVSQYIVHRANMSTEVVTNRGGIARKPRVIMP